MMRKFIIGLFVILVLFIICGCSQQNIITEEKMDVITDGIGRNIEITVPLTRVVVANTYNTELINAIGAIDTVVGVDYAIYQDEEGYKGRFKMENVIGKSQRELNYERIIELAPQALILTGNGSWQEAEEKLSPFGIKVIVLDAYYTDRFFDNCKLLGALFGKKREAEELSSYFEEKLDYIKTNLSNAELKSVYFEYRREGNTTVPGDYFYNMVKYAGGKNIFEDAVNVSVDSESIIERNPQCIVKVGENNVSSSYIPPTETEFIKRMKEIKNRPGWDSIDAVKNNKILLLSHFCHGGASKLVGTMYIAKFMYPELLPELNPEEVFKVWLEKYQGLKYISGHTYPAFSL
jgi:iron complex transport system substrate-binding protein